NEADLAEERPAAEDEGAAGGADPGGAVRAGAGERAGGVSAAGAVGPLGGVRVERLAAQGGAGVQPGADDLLQLRGGLRAAGVRRQGDAGDPQAGGQPVSPGQPRAELRQGAGDAEPGERPGADPVPAAAGGAARRRAVGAGLLGRGAGGPGGADPAGDRGGAQD